MARGGRGNLAWEEVVPGKRIESVRRLCCLQTQYGALCQYILMNRHKKKREREGRREE